MEASSQISQHELNLIKQVNVKEVEKKNLMAVPLGREGGFKGPAIKKILKLFST